MGNFSELAKRNSHGGAHDIAVCQAVDLWQAKLKCDCWGGENNFSLQMLEGKEADALDMLLGL